MEEQRGSGEWHEGRKEANMKRARTSEEKMSGWFKHGVQSTSMLVECVWCERMRNGFQEDVRRNVSTCAMDGNYYLSKSPKASWPASIQTSQCQGTFPTPSLPVSQLASNTIHNVCSRRCTDAFQPSESTSTPSPSNLRTTTSWSHHAIRDGAPRPWGPFPFCHRGGSFVSLRRCVVADCRLIRCDDGDFEDDGHWHVQGRRMATCGSRGGVQEGTGSDWEGDEATRWTTWWRRG